MTPGSRIVSALDVHAAGEPLRILTSGFPDIPGATMLARRRWMQAHLDDVRTALMWEPRGHANMYGCVLVPPVSAEADVGVLFMHNGGYSTMCGHGIIALVTALVETRTIAAQGQQTPVRLDTPAGLVCATAHLTGDGHVERVSFVNVPSFVLARECVVAVPNVGEVTLDVAFGGAFYAILPANRVGLAIEPSVVGRLVEVGEAIKRAVQQQLVIAHPLEADLGYLYGTIFTGPPRDVRHDSQNVCIFADGEVDRSPTGTGVSARLALGAARGELEPGQQAQIESILGAESVFAGRIVGETMVGTLAAVLPEVSGSAFITGWHEFVLNENDRLAQGFLVR